MSYNTKNYTEQGGEKTVIGGTLEIKEGASVTGLSANPLLVATEETLGGIKAAAAGDSDTVEVKIGDDGKLYVPALAMATSETLGGVIAEDTATLVTDFNALLAKLKAAGLMAADEE